MKKRLTALSLSLLMVLGLLPAHALAAPEGASTQEARDEATGVQLTKSAYWLDEERQTAEIELTVQGKSHETITTEPVNVVLMLDISESMIWQYGDMPCLGEHTLVTNFGDKPVYTCSITHKQLAEKDPSKHIVHPIDVAREHAAIFMESLAESEGAIQVLPILFSDSAAPYMASKFDPYRFSNDYKELAQRIRDIPNNLVNHDTSYSQALTVAREFILKLGNLDQPTKVIFLSDGVPQIGHAGVEESKALRSTVTGGRNVELYTIGFNLYRNSIYDNSLPGSQYAAENYIKNITSTPLSKYGYQAEESDALRVVFESIANDIKGIVPSGRDLTLTDVIADPFELDHTRWVELPAGVTVDGQTVTWKTSATTEVGTSLTIPIRVKDGAPASFALSNTNVSADLSYTDYQDGKASLSVDSPQLDRKGADPVRALELHKSAVVSRTGSHDTLRAGDRIDYTVSIANTGEEAETGVLLTDSLF